MQASGRNWDTPIAFVEDLRQRLAEALDHVDPDIETIAQMAIEAGRGDLSPLAYVEYLYQQAYAFEEAQVRLDILDELRNVSPAIRDFIAARQMAVRSLRIIAKG